MPGHLKKRMPDESASRLPDASFPLTLAELADQTTQHRAPPQAHTSTCSKQSGQPSLLDQVAVGAWAVSYALDVVALLSRNERLARRSFTSMLFGWVTAMPLPLSGMLEAGALPQGDPQRPGALSNGLLSLGSWLVYGANLLTRGQRGGRVHPFSLGLSTLGLSLAAGRFWKRGAR